MRPLVVSLKSVRSVVFAALLAAVAMAFAPAAALAQQARFFAVGDLPGGSFHSEVRDATKVGDTILAVGHGNGQTLNCPNPCAAGDTAILWKWDGTAATIVALPNLVVNTTATSFVTAAAITPDGAYIASRARSNSSSSNPGVNNQRQAVRVTTALVPFTSANLPIATFAPAAVGANSFASAISADGSILYGQHSGTGRAVRFDAAGGTSIAIPTPGGWAQLAPAARGTSADGSVMVGSANNFNFYAGQAFRYVYGGAASPIPPLAGGSWNGAVAVSSDGSLAMVLGNSSAYPNGEVYLYDATSGATTPLGSPNSAWAPLNAAGMTPDGSVVAISFVTLDPGSNRGFPYFRNSHGWFLVASALGANGIDVKAQGWTELTLMGMSSDGTLLFGSGVHNDQVEGWVAEFPAGYLATFNPLPVAPSNTSIVGAWRVNDTESGSPAVVVFMADGTYYLIQATVTATEVNAAAGFERGLYTWDGTTGAFTVTTLNDTNGDAGLSDNNGMLNATVFVSGDTLSLAENGPAIGSRIKAPGITPQDPIIGAWVAGNPARDDGSLVIVFDGIEAYYLGMDGPGADDGIEYGTYQWNPGSGEFSVTTAVDTNLSSGPGSVEPQVTQALALSANRLGATYSNTSPESLGLARVVDPSVITTIASPLSAAGNLGAPFSYTIAATNGAYAFGATGLPAGLSLSGSTITGTPTVIGSFNVALTAANTVSSAGATLSITIVTTAVTSTGGSVTVAPDVPPGTPPLSVTFDNVATGGTTSVTILDPTVAPAVPTASGYSIGYPAIYYDVSTTAALAPGSGATLCFNYAGIDFGGNTPRLLHYEGGAWRDITTSVDAATTPVCGVTTSFSPFTIAGNPVPFLKRTGFYSPVSMTSAFVNTVKGGSTVPLKFNVYVNGVEKTDTAGLQFSVAPVACSSAVAEDAVDWVTSEGTSLRYDATERQFIQNWKTPKAPGTCYLARVTTAADGRSLSANFKLK
jgi:hypothetical protein